MEKDYPVRVMTSPARCCAGADVFMRTVARVFTALDQPAADRVVRAGPAALPYSGCGPPLTARRPGPGLGWPFPIDASDHHRSATPMPLRHRSAAAAAASRTPFDDRRTSHAIGTLATAFV